MDSPFTSDKKSVKQHHSTHKQQSRTMPLGHSTSAQQQDASGSQMWEEGILNVEDITITVDDKDSDKNKSTSSSSTLIEDDSLTPLETKKKPSVQECATDRQQQQEMLQILSQEQFGADDQTDMIMSLNTQDQNTALPLSNYYESYYNEEQDTFPPPAHTFRTEHSQTNNYQVLSQPNSATPPKSRHGKSLTDLTGSNGNLSCSQPYLSQSIADFQHMQQRHMESSRHYGGGQRHMQSYRPHPPSRMSSDPHLNKSLPPGLQSSVLHALRENPASKRNYSVARKGMAGLGHHSNAQSQPPRGSRTSPSSQRGHMKASSLVQRSASSKKSPSEKK